MASSPNRLVSRKPIPRPYASADYAASSRTVSSPEWYAANQQQNSTPPNKVHPLPASQSPGNSPHVSPLGSPIYHIRSRSGSNTALPNFSDLDSYPPENSPPSRPVSNHSDKGSSEGGKLKRRSWFPGSGGRSRATSQGAAGAHTSTAWVIAGPERLDYNVQRLFQAEKVPELWNEHGDTYVYLYPLSARRGPSFKISSRLISSSPFLMKLAFGNSHDRRRQRAKSFDNRNTLTVEDATRLARLRDLNTPPHTPKVPSFDNQSSSDSSRESDRSTGTDTPREGHLYFPIPQYRPNMTQEEIALEELDRLVAARNLFAFLTEQQLVATRRCSTIFAIFCLIARQLKGLDFSNVDGSTYGELASSAFEHYLEEMSIADVRSSREKTIEGLILGERMRSMTLYNEAFAHGVGKYKALMDMDSRLYKMVSENTRTRLDRAALDLSQRLKSVNLRLSDFDFPSLFAGIAASTSSPESKFVRFKAWKPHFSMLRKHVMSYYKDLHGAWPPKASSKKNGFVESGLNRLVLKLLYSDMCSLYDLLVDRDSITTRSLDVDDVSPENDPTAAALRKLLSEFDRSSPPVQPPVPFDVPLVPTMETLSANHYQYSARAQQEAETRRLKDHETLLVLTKSHNLDASKRSPFLDAFYALEEREARSKSIQELSDQRYGYWIFIYVVVQSLPLLVVDAPDLKWTTGVEYFLCEPPIGGAPWIEDGSSVQRSWYGVAGGSGVVSMPSDIVKHGVEGIYRRSHCWLMAERWLLDLHIRDPHPPARPAPVPEQYNTYQPPDPAGLLSPLEPPPPLGMDYRPTSRGPERPSHSRHSSGSASPHPRPRTAGSNVPRSQPQAPEDERPRSRSISKHRSSIGLGLEELPIPHGYDMPIRSSRRSSRSPSMNDSPPFVDVGMDSRMAMNMDVGINYERDRERKPERDFGPPVGPPVGLEGPVRPFGSAASQQPRPQQQRRKSAGYVNSPTSPSQADSGYTRPRAEQRRSFSAGRVPTYEYDHPPLPASSSAGYEAQWQSHAYGQGSQADHRYTRRGSTSPGHPHGYGQGFSQQPRSRQNSGSYEDPYAAARGGGSTSPGRTNVWWSNEEIPRPMEAPRPRSAERKSPGVGNRGAGSGTNGKKTFDDILSEMGKEKGKGKEKDVEREKEMGRMEKWGRGLLK